MRLHRRSALLAAALVLGGPAMAADATPEAAESSRLRGHRASISFSPIHLLLPVVEAQVEVYLGERLSLAAIGGGGQATVTSGDVKETFTVWELGGQLRFYFHGSSEEGAHVGSEVLWARVEGDVDGTGALGNGLAAGIMAGYKWVWDGGFLIDLNGGAAYAVARAESDDGDEAEDSRVLPILNFNLGWAF